MPYQPDDKNDNHSPDKNSNNKKPYDYSNKYPHEKEKERNPYDINRNSERLY